MHAAAPTPESPGMPHMPPQGRKGARSVKQLEMLRVNLTEGCMHLAQDDLVSPASLWQQRHS